MSPSTQPGFVDLQVNGFGGEDANAPDLTTETVVALTRKLWAEGTTTYLPTIITASEPRMLHALEVVAAARRLDSRVAHSIAGVHLEGPALSAIDGARGAHDPSAMRDPSLAELDRWQEASGGLVRVVTLAPERPGAAEFASGAVERGVHVSLGHAAPTPDDVHAAADAGATLSTHLGNGSARLLPRHPNHLWAQLADDRLTAMLITDGHHLDADTATAMIRAKGTHRVLLTSDSAALAGSAPGTYRTPVGGDVTVCDDGRLQLSATGLLAGSGCSLRQCVDWARSALPLPDEDLVAMATTQPARMLGLTDRTADTVVLDLDESTSRVREVRVAGDIVHTA
ncbi:N-acetylglucosamine-6-phosphate deacetylase [Microbacterium sp. JB110]|uniref:N-acetylglucosamine-6-phosphate deacetylase n=1 Tax=Microbacterium sp. JB110 TaxID=2024477 RepID=UPI00097EA298|nr:amidohydrolase family protein [Microbacterium sp. JB110]RCS60092.1 N-acetylglucosamine-6-phosphate deacetylase [Microbacterium sp. JB110]SJM45457.1 N-acetylglucosamine-6-phosphate deacetylase [Frigoribacterium sp. JB110]